MKLYSYNDKCNCSGSNIRKAREKAGLSQEELAAKLQRLGMEVTQKTVSRVETGARVLPDFELKFYAEALKKDILWLLGEKE